MKAPQSLLREAIALHEKGGVAEAAARYAEVLRREPGNVDALYFAGLAHCQQGRFADAAAMLTKVVALAPRHPGAHNLLGLALKDIGRPDEALRSFDLALALKPDFLDALMPRAEVLTAAGLWADAVAAYDRVLALAPQMAEAWFGRGNAEAVLGRDDKAIASFDRALALRGDVAAIHLSRGNALRRLQRLDEALAGYDRAIALQPALAETHFSRGAALEEQGRLAEAIASFDRALTLPESSPGGAALTATILSHRAWVANQSGRFEQAFADMARSVELAPDHDGVLFQSSFIDLLHGRWLEAWPKYERRLRLRNDLPAAFNAAAWPRYSGEPLPGALLLLVTEQGLGDAIQFAGFASELAARGFRIALFTAPMLVPLLSAVPGVETVVSSMEQLGAAGDIRWFPLLSVPGLLATTPDTVPRMLPLPVPPARVAAWRERLGPGFKAGIAWQGNVANLNDLGRSVPLAQFAPLAALPGVRLLSLQKGAASAQIASVAFQDRIEAPLDVADTSADALIDTAALMMNLDCVVTSDSMLAHLAGVLGRPTLVALRRYPDWRWLLDRDDSPWYPAMRLFRQTVDGDWTDVFGRIAAAVDAARAA